MKKTFCILVLSLFIVSCKTQKSGHCDTYGYYDTNKDIEFDIQKINQNTNSKYVTTFSIK